MLLSAHLHTSLPQENCVPRDAYDGPGAALTVFPAVLLCFRVPGTRVASPAIQTLETEISGLFSMPPFSQRHTRLLLILQH